MSALLRRLSFQTVPWLCGGYLRKYHPARMNTAQLLEEETLPFYKHEQYYPVKIGQILDSSYKILGKLGYGSYSTVWLARDVRCVP